MATSLEELSLREGMGENTFAVMKNNQKEKFKLIFGFDPHREKSIRMYKDYMSDLITFCIDQFYEHTEYYGGTRKLGLILNPKVKHPTMNIHSFMKKIFCLSFIDNLISVDIRQIRGMQRIREGITKEKELK